MKLPSVYEPGKHESDIYKQWEQSGVFTANPHSSKPHFSMSMPPPNETGTLHVGHALFLTLQDIIARHQRQQGKDVLWLPGTDHAALATNAIIEKRLAEQGTDKHQVGREEFLRQTKEFVGNSRDTINSQVRAMGASVDWGRARYTLDDALNRCVNEVFVKMYNDGLIYRGHRIVNWDPNLETTVSDDEVIHKEEHGTFYTLQYGPFQIGTARPETKFGDKYVVMHPDDKRYAKYKTGDTFEAEWINGPVTATVIKDEAVDPKFGTGVMTITPWHDHTDFDIAERHSLEKEQIIGFDGKLLPIAGEFSGMDIEEARPEIVQKLRAKGLLVKTDDNYMHNLALNDRGKGVIEPQVKLQWFVDVNRPAVEWKGQLRSLREVMRAVIEDGDIKIVPKRFEKIYYHWIDNLRDWCVSRQIWWGHQIPVWYKGDEIYTGVKPPEGQGWQQDPDTLDTWFSSSLWTWSTLVDQQLAKDYSISFEDLLQQSIDFKTYHPTDVLETGWDILFFWVARMILATTYATGQIPFKTVYLHGLVRHESGRKMSKSDPETIIDPMEVIPQYGTDALRLALVSGVNAGQDLRLGRSKIVDNRNFCNKLWNIARYSNEVISGETDVNLTTIADSWILWRLQKKIKQIKSNLEKFEFSEAYSLLYHFVRNDFADWYIESNKIHPNSEVLKEVLESTLKITHPFAPFITEAIWRDLELEEGILLASKEWPSLPKFDIEKARDFSEGIMKLSREVRQIQTILGERKQNLLFEASEIIEDNDEMIKHLARLGTITQVSKGRGLKLTKSTRIVAWLDINPKLAKDKIATELKKYEESEKMLQSRLNNPGYKVKAPKMLIEQTQKELTNSRVHIKQLEEMLNGLEG